MPSERLRTPHAKLMQLLEPHALPHRAETAQRGCMTSAFTGQAASQCSCGRLLAGCLLLLPRGGRRRMTARGTSMQGRSLMPRRQPLLLRLKRHRSALAALLLEPGAPALPCHASPVPVARVLLQRRVQQRTRCLAEEGTERGGTKQCVLSSEWARWHPRPLCRPGWLLVQRLEAAPVEGR